MYTYIIRVSCQHIKVSGFIKIVERWHVVTLNGNDVTLELARLFFVEQKNVSAFCRVLDRDDPISQIGTDFSIRSGLSIQK